MPPPPGIACDTVRAALAGRVRVADGDAETAPGVTPRHVGGRSAGLQAARVRARRGWLALASGVVHVHEDVDGRASFPIIRDLVDMHEGFAIVIRLASHRSPMIPGHDPLVLARDPPVRPNLAGVAVRLDADPPHDVREAPMDIARHERTPRAARDAVPGGVAYPGGMAADEPRPAAGARTARTLPRMEARLARAASGRARLPSVTIQSSEMRRVDGRDAVRGAWLDPEDPPARACVDAGPARPGFEAETTAIAAAGG